MSDGRTRTDKVFSVPIHLAGTPGLQPLVACSLTTSASEVAAGIPYRREHHVVRCLRFNVGGVAGHGKRTRQECTSDRPPMKDCARVFLIVRIRQIGRASWRERGEI